MIKAFSLRRLHNGEFITFNKEFLEIIAAPNLPASVKAARGVLAACMSALEGAHVNEDDSDLSAERRELDARRDELYAGLRHLAEVYQTNPVAGKAAAGHKLAARFDDYGTLREVIDGGDADESADINGILSDLASPGLAAAGAVIGAGEWIEELARVQAAFMQKTQERNKQRSDRAEAQPDNIDTLRARAEKAYRSLCSKINSFNETEEGAEPWPGIISKSNVLIAAYRNLLAARQGRAASKAPAAS